MATRRDILAAGVTLPFLPAVAQPVAPRIVLLGQALIQHDLRQTAWDDRAAFSKIFAAADASFTDLETTIIGPHGGAVTRDPALLHRAEPAALDCLAAMGLNLFATANNHAYDVGTGGITDTMDALAARHLTYAGTGRDLATAEAPAFLATSHGTVALVAAATGKIRPGGAATPDRPGVNEIRQSAPGVLDKDDTARFLQAIAQAAKRARLVIAYDHNHYWEPDIADAPAWQVALAHQCIDAGAGVFVGHGAPLLQAIEIYRGQPIFYGLGNFIYQSPSHEDPYGPATWQGVMADCRFNAAGFQAELIPIVLNSAGLGGADDMETKGMPHLAGGAEAQIILQGLAEKSRRFATRLTISNGIGRLA